MAQLDAQGIAVPYLRVNSARASQALLQTLFEVSQLTVRLNGLGDVVTIGGKRPADQVPAIAEAGEKITDDVWLLKQQKAPTEMIDAFAKYPRWDSNPRYRRERPAS